MAKEVLEAKGLTYLLLSKDQHYTGLNGSD